MTDRPGCSWKGCKIVVYCVVLRRRQSLTYTLTDILFCGTCLLLCNPGDLLLFCHSPTYPVASIPALGESRPRQRRDINLLNLWSHTDAGSWATALQSLAWLEACTDLSSHSEIGTHCLSLSYYVYSAEASALVRHVLWFQTLLEHIISSWQWIKTK